MGFARVHLIELSIMFKGNAWGERVNAVLRPGCLASDEVPVRCDQRTETRHIIKARRLQSAGKSFYRLKDSGKRDLRADLVATASRLQASSMTRRMPGARDSH